MSADSRPYFRRFNIFPTADDLGSNRDLSLRKNKVKELYKDTNDYLDVQVRLLREDFLDPWRQTLNEVRNRYRTRSPSEVEVFKVQFIQDKTCPRKRSHKGFSDRVHIRFDRIHRKELRRSERDRFQYGSLVCLSDDNFRTLVVATIAGNRELSDGSLELSVGSNIRAKDELRFDWDYELVENTNVCFETYKYFFELLKEMDNLPFQRYLLDPKLKEIPAPNYLLSNPHFHFSSLLNLEIISQHQMAPVLCLDSWPGPDELDLDWSQYHALRLALTKELAVIQGPPGTGKTYVGLKIVQLLLENNGGLGEQIRSDDDDVDDRSRSILFPGPIILLSHTNHALDQFLEAIIKIYPKETYGQNRSIFRIGGRSRSRNEDLQNCILQIDTRNPKSSLTELKNAKIIAMTTSGAAKHHNLINSLQPKVVIVEEAGEILESHLVACLPKTCKHLILIGDHQQLRPRPASYSLERDFELGVSLFERLVRNNLPRVCLIEQRRMRPEIADLLTPHIYKTLRNHESVYEYDDVAGIYGNLLFINHNNEESIEDDNRSYSNDHEAEFLVKLCEYLLGVGYRPSQITMLVTYASQEKKIRSLSRAQLSGVRVATVDNYQGEENDIILLSLVRSNQRNCIGFLDSPNRVCVALSRARLGLYIIGNGDLLRSKSDLWKRILKSLKTQGKIVRSLRLGCHKHQGKVYQVARASQFNCIPKAGCSQQCGFELPHCGRRCKMSSLQSRPDHIDYNRSQQSSTTAFGTDSQHFNEINFRLERERTGRMSEKRSPSRDQYQNDRNNSGCEHYSETSAMKRPRRQAEPLASKQDPDRSPSVKRRRREDFSVCYRSQIEADRKRHGHSRRPRDSGTYKQVVFPDEHPNPKHQHYRTPPVQSEVQISESRNYVTPSYQKTYCRQLEPSDTYADKGMSKSRSNRSEITRNKHHDRWSQRDEERSERNIYTHHGDITRAATDRPTQSNNTADLRNVINSRRADRK